MFPFPIGICARSLCSLRMLIYFVSEIVVQNICNLPVNDNGPISMYSKCQKRVLKNVQNTEPLCSMHLVHVVTPRLFYLPLSYGCYCYALHMEQFWFLTHCSIWSSTAICKCCDGSGNAFPTYIHAFWSYQQYMLNANFIPVILPKKLHIKQIMIVVRVSIEKNPYKIG